MSSSASRVDLVGWKEICVRFYLNGDETARDALSAFERGQAAPRTGPNAEQSCGQPASTLDSETNLRATELLASVGLTNVASLDTETLSACIASKNAARRESHAVVRPPCHTFLVLLFLNVFCSCLDAISNEFIL